MRESETHSADELTRRRLREPRPTFRSGPRAGPEARTLTTWPGWLPGHARSGPRGPYLVAGVRLWVPTGRTFFAYGLVEEQNIRAGLSHLSAGVPGTHSGLQEPHGGHPCAFTHEYLRLWQDDPITLRQWAEISRRDGPREGLGEVTIAVRTLSQEGALQHEEVDALECNLRSDIAGLLERFPARSASRFGCVFWF
ncbi:hypothetical protein ACIQF5_33830 [Streptomyces goshikiensis]|uniref:hypothetical protein n=1 Tax=Streptomyces goshikiensis TaxID=1942 RepID=UPI0037F7781A